MSAHAFFSKGTDIALIQEFIEKVKDMQRLQNKHYNIIASSSSLIKTEVVLALIERKQNIAVDMAGGGPNCIN